MKQYGDITQLSGYDLDPVDLIVGGSPCQDLSVAGKRAGLDGERSGLFLEMIRIIKQMREKTNGIYPRYALWENVPGAFSSNNGRDFGAVLGEFARIIEPNAPDVPVPQEGWPKAGVLLGSNWSIAWRTHDAQHWGVPQRRRRISLVADFRGQSAWEILFERKSLSGNIEQGSETGEDSAGTSEDSLRETGKDALIVQNDQGGAQMDVSDGTAMTLRHQSHGHEPVILEERERERERTLSFQERSGKPGGGKGILIQVNHVGALSTLNNQMILDDKNNSEAEDRPAVYDPSVHHDYRQFDDVSETVRSRYGTGGNNQRLVVATMQGFGDYVESGTASSCKQRDYKDATDKVCCMDPDMLPVAIGNGQVQTTGMYEKCPTLSTMHDQQAVMVYGHSSFGNYKEGIGSLRAAGGDNGGGSENLVTTHSTQQYDMQDKCQYVRRLTPLECERLQGYPDGWTAIPGASDSSRYKALGNSIALPFWEHLAHRFADIGGVKTIGSLFDGIGGFPLVFKRAGVKTLWTSEIEPFCQKVVEWHVANGDL